MGSPASWGINGDAGSPDKPSRAYSGAVQAGRAMVTSTDMWKWETLVSMKRLLPLFGALLLLAGPVAGGAALADPGHGRGRDRGDRYEQGGQWSGDRGGRWARGRPGQDDRGDGRGRGRGNGRVADGREECGPR